MLLVVDAGNTNIVFGVFQGEELLHSWRISTYRSHHRTGDELTILLHNLLGLIGLSFESLDGAAVCSVVPPLNDGIKRMCHESLKIDTLFIDSKEQDFITLNYRVPEEVGADRIVNAVAAKELFGSPVVVVDFGTATTFDVVTRDGSYDGGLIFPGIGISSEALFTRTSKLPKVEFCKPPHMVGKSTEESIQAGLYYGYVKMVKGILEELKKELPEASVVSTGGYSRMINRNNPGLFNSVEKDLTVKGLKICYDSYKGN